MSAAGDVFHGKLTRNGSRVVRLTKREFDELGDYSCSLPTGTIVGKQWKRREPYEDGPPGTVHKWYMGEYVESEKEGYVNIEWSLIEVLSDREAQILHIYPNGIDGNGRPAFDFNGSDGNAIERKRANGS